MTRFSSVLLVGGQSKRMGQDKALMDWHGRPLWAVQTQKLISVGSQTVYLAARKEQKFAARIESYLSPEETGQVHVIEDPLDEDCGPLGAIVRCLVRAQTPLLVLAVDMPLMTVDFLRHHVISAATPGKGLVYTGKHGPEVLGALYILEMLPRMTEAQRSGAYSLQALVSQFERDHLCDVREISEGDSHHWSNLNTPEQAEQILRFKH